jgi:hypothetical protein
VLDAERALGVPVVWVERHGAFEMIRRRADLAALREVRAPLELQLRPHSPHDAAVERRGQPVAMEERAARNRGDERDCCHFPESRELCGK